GRYPEFAGLYVADRDARTLAFVPLYGPEGEYLVGKSYADRPYYRALKERREMVYSGVYQARGGMSEPAVAIGVPVLGDDGELATFVLGWFDVNRSFQRIVDRFDADAHGTVAVITDRRSRLIADSRLEPGSYTEVRDLSGSPDYRLAAGRPEGSVLVSREGEQDESPALAVARAHHLLTFTTEPVTGWRIWIHQSLAPVQATLLGSTATHLLVLVLALLAALALSAGLARLVTAPLERLRRSAERLAAGDLSERPEETALPTVEIDSLFRSFSGMADRLDQSWQLQHRLLEQVSVTNQELQATFDAMTDAVVITDAEDRVLHANHAFHEMGGMEPGWAVGRLLYEVSHPDGGWQGCRSCVARRSGESATVRLRADENATGRPAEIRLDQLRDRDGGPLRSVQVIRDRTDEERAAERDRQDDKLRALGQLAAGVAHNFNNALTSVLGYTQLAASLTDDGRLRSHLDTVEVAALDAAKMVRRIQQFARSDKEEPLEEASLDALVQDAVTLTRSHWESDAQAAGIRYRLHLRPGADQVVRCDPSALREVFVNLIINALDAMPDGG
ncbi:MAG TPA: HAMP domain-containing protein, partial [Thermoanaerobaculia bacterium]|nr:HAMP domain-containing protein [Thermoanaerobaculia bacterium]